MILKKTFIILIFFTLFLSCGKKKEPITSILSIDLDDYGQLVGFGSDETKLLNLLKSELNNDISSLIIPKVDDSIRYEIKYARKMETTFITRPEKITCRYSFQRKIYSEKVISKGDRQLYLEKREEINPQDATYIGDPIENIKTHCDFNKRNYLTLSPVKIDNTPIALTQTVRDNQNYFKREIFQLIDSCKYVKPLTIGKCRYLKLLRIEKKRMDNHDKITSYLVEFLLVGDKKDLTILREFSLNHTYFTPGGLIRQQESSPLPQDNPTKKIKDFAILCLNDHCF